ncbi:MAG: arginine--tRNA ligase [Gammaproteobacteria bacterium]|nr:arginine--tRNA ligase [Gammaproteobacteria bacterium]NNJ71933.1 arginine--tRNA ligase [Enterobacterales bacterium]
MKDQLTEILTSVVDKLKQEQILPEDFVPRFTVERTKNPEHGDLASNIALVSSKALKMSPRDAANLIVERLEAVEIIEDINIAGPGFINFFLSKDSATAVVAQAINQAENFGCNTQGEGKKVILEFVSANPTGPLHVGHGRGAAYGASLANLLQSAGWQVHTEYYVNDAGRQMHILAVSVWVRFLQQQNLNVPFPVNGYRGDYIQDIAKKLIATQNPALIVSVDQLLSNLPEDESSDGGDKEAYIDALIERAKNLLGESNYNQIFNLALEEIRAGIEQDLAEFGVHFNHWYSEKGLLESGAIESAIQGLEEKGYMYRKDGNLWFKSTDFGDDKDRVVVRANGQTTYFASDIAYHMDKLERGFDQIIDIFGADHHGYVTRVKASMKALGANPEQLHVPLVQFAILYRGGEKVPMSTRSGEFVTLEELRNEVGNDAARFFYVMRKAEQHMDFDLDLAKSQSNENPMYYIQYAHARIASLFRRLSEANYQFDQEQGLQALVELTTQHELALIKRLSAYPDLIANAALQLEPHSIAHYLRDLSNEFHSYYNAEKLIVDSATLRNARFCLISAVKQTLRNGLAILGVSAPEEM